MSAKSKYIFAIDPGPEKSAMVLIETETKKVVSCGYDSNSDMLFYLDNAIPEYGKTGNVAFYIEMVACYGMPVGREVFETCVWIGQFARCVSRALDRVVWPGCCVYRREVKLYLCNSMRAKDNNVRKALIDCYPKTGKTSKGEPSAIGTQKHPGPLYGIKGDIWSALAVAVTAAERMEQG